jgi:hypothetical protein
VLSSLDHAQQWDNKVDINIEGHYTCQNMLEVVSSGVSNLVPHKTRGGNQSTKIPIHPTPLHANVVLMHTLRDIEGAQNHFLKFVEVEVDQYVMIPWELPYLYQSRYNLACLTCFHAC